jgi:hypothetical protein
LQTLALIKRSTANTLGTGAATGTPVPVDSGQAAASATLDIYTAAPTLGTAVGTLMTDHAQVSAPTNAGVVIGLVSPSTAIPQNPVMAGDLRRGIVLRGINEALYLNYGGAALTAGFTALYGFEWIEI